jgi:hypothetical protein
MIYYNPEYDFIGLLDTVDGILLQIEETNEYIALTDRWVLIGEL